MVDIVTPRALPTARSAGQVSNAGSQALKELAGATQMAADKFSEYYEKKAAIEGDRLLAEIQEEWTRTYSESAKSAGSGFARTTLESYDEFVAGKLEDYRQRMADQHMARVPERNMDNIQLVLDKYRMKLETRAMQREAAARAAAAAAARAETTRLRANAILSDPSLAEDAIAAAPDDRTRRTYVQAYLNGMLIADDPQTVADAMASGQFDADLTTSQKLSFMKAADSGLASLERERQIALAEEQRSFEADLEESLAYTSANGFVPPHLAVEPEDFDTMYPDDPERAAATRAAYEEGLMFSEAVHDVGTARPEDIAAEMDRLNTLVSEPGNTPTDVKRRDAYASAVQTRATAISNDAAGFVIQQEDTVSQLYDMVQSEVASAADGRPEADPAAVTGHYVAALDTMYDSMGVPESMRTVVPVSQARRDVATLSTAGTDVAAQLLTSMSEQWGEAAPVYIAQLQKEGLAPEYVAAMRFADDPGLSQMILSVAGVSEADLKDGLVSTDVTAMNSELTSSISEYRQAFEMAGTPEAISMMNDQYGVATKLALSYIRGGADPASAAQKVFEQLFPETPVLNNDAAFLLPEGLSESAVLSGLDAAQDIENLRGADIAPINDIRYPEFADMEVTLEAASNGIWVNNSIGDGVQLMVSVDGYHIPLLKSDGSYYEVKFADAAAMNTGGFFGSMVRAITWGGVGK